MKLHDSYKCQTCGKFHPLELDLLLKNMLTTKMWRQLDPDEICLLGQYKLARNKGPRAIQAADRMNVSMREADQKCLMFDPACPNSMLEYERIEWDYQWCIRKAVALNQRVCIDEFKKAVRYDISFPARVYDDSNDEGKMQKMAASTLDRYHKYVKLSTNHPVNQWLEITDRATLHLKPIWFTGHRVYQFPVLAREPDFRIDGAKHYECKVRINNEETLVVSFHAAMQYRMHEFKLRLSPSLKNDDFHKLANITTQMQDFKPTYSELRIIYYRSTRKPRIWIRSPGTSHKIVRNTINDLVPIYSDTVEKLNLLQPRKLIKRRVADQTNKKEIAKI